MSENRSERPAQASAPCPEAPSSPFQFSLLTLLIVTTVVAVLCSALFSMPVWFAVWTIPILMILTPMVLVVVLIYGRGYDRTFCIGGLFPAGAFLYVGLLGMRGYPGFDLGSGRGDERIWLALAVAIGLGFVVASGLLAMGVRWMVERPYRRPTPPDTHPLEPRP